MKENMQELVMLVTRQSGVKSDFQASEGFMRKE